MATIYAMVATDGSVIERYDYGDFGRPLFLSAAGAVQTSSAIATGTGASAGHAFAMPRRVATRA